MWAGSPVLLGILSAKADSVHSWSQSGHLLASGSDDTCINIHTTKPNFAFNTSIQTGHTANIFSVKFMPFSDNKIVSCAGDWEVRVYDVEYAPTANTLTSSSKPVMTTAVPPSSYRSRRDNIMSLPEPAKLYNIGEAETRVFTSHTDRAKRIVTEGSPWLFLTCSEDGEVRQFDLRQPSQYYSRGSGSSEVRFRASLFPGIDILAGPTGEADERNPPLISYKKHRIELNTISCSVGQPHYIALGGSHQHCFLHDRRMLGRDVSTERGQPSSFTENELSSATRCVKRFEPQKPSGRAPSRLKGVRDNGHITACKISDANPNELVVSWSGDSIYLFDINRNPADTRRKNAGGLEKGTGEGRVNPEQDRKGKARESISQSGELHIMEDSMTERLGSGRKRKRSRDTAGGSATGEAPRCQRSARSSSEDDKYDEDGDLVIEFTTGHTEQGLYREGEVDLTEIPGHSMMRVAGLVVDMRRELFELQSAERSPISDENEVANLTIMKRPFTSALGLAKICIERMDDIIDIHKTKNPRRERISASGFKRARARRFVQACGALAFALSGHIHTLSPISHESMERHFGQIQGTPGPESIRSEGIPIFSNHLGWRYSFLQLMIAYIRNGLVGIYTLAAQHGYHSAVVGESEESDRVAQNKFFDSIESWWPYELLSHSPLNCIDSPAEVIIAGGEGEAWRLFREEVEKEEQASVERRIEFWGVKVARALLYREGNIIDFAFVNSIYGAGEDALEEVRAVLPLSNRRQRGPSQGRRRSTSIEPMSVDTDDEGEETTLDHLPGIISGSSLEATMFGESGTRDDDAENSQDLHEDEYGGLGVGVYSDGTDDEEGDGEEGEEGEEEDNDYDDNDGEPENRRRDQWRRWERDIDPQAPIWNAVRTYSGHCNVKTVCMFGYLLTCVS